MTNDSHFVLNPTGKKILTPTDLLDMRNRLVKEYGEKIILGSKEHMTTKEKVACVAYKTLTDQLHKLAPDTVKPDKMTELYVKYKASNIFELIINYIKMRI